MNDAVEALPQGVAVLVKQIGNVNGVKRVMLYGSRARGDAAERSDFDLAVDAPGLDLKMWGAIEDMVEGAETLYKIDCVWLQKAAADLKANIARDGKVLLQK